MAKLECGFCGKKGMGKRERTRHTNYCKEDKPTPTIDLPTHDIEKFSVER
jgi:hypothetical protein